jgi:hypothetical protein
MKKFIVTSMLAATAAYVHAQGTIQVYSVSSTFTAHTSTAAYSANGSATGGTLAATANTPFAYDYVLLAEPYNASLTDTMPSLTALGSLALAVTGITNYGLAGGIGGPGHNLGSSTLLTTSWTAPQAAYTDGTGVEDTYVLVGWSANLGSSWTTVYNELISGSEPLGFFGTTPYGAGYTGGGPNSLPAPDVFGVSTAEPGGFVAGPTLYTTVPEPTTIALGVMGAASLLALRRKKA